MLTVFKHVFCLGFTCFCSEFRSSLVFSSSHPSYNWYFLQTFRPRCLFIPAPFFCCPFLLPPPLLLATKINHRDTGVCKTGKKKIHRRVQKCRHGPMQEEYQTCKWGKTCVLIFVFKCLFDIWRLMFVHSIFYCHSKLQWEKCYDISYWQT